MEKRMNSNHDQICDLQGQVNTLEDNADIEISQSLLNVVDPNVDPMSFMFDNETTPVKACGDLFYHVTNNEVNGKESEQYRVPSSRGKRRRVLNFEPEVLEEHLSTDDSFLRSMETTESFEDVMSEWVAGFAGTSASNNDGLGQASDDWITDCLNDLDMQLCSEDASNTSEFQIGTTDHNKIDSHRPEYGVKAVKKTQPVNTHQNVVFKGRKSIMSMPHNLASSIVYPFAFIKPCGAHGDMTLKDINEKIHNPLKSRSLEDPSVSYPKSAFSGKPVIGKTKIHTEGGKGSITIMRTKG